VQWLSFGRQLNRLTKEAIIMAGLRDVSTDLYIKSGRSVFNTIRYSLGITNISHSAGRPTKYSSSTVYKRWNVLVIYLRQGRQKVLNNGGHILTENENETP